MRAREDVHAQVEYRESTPLSLQALGSRAYRLKYH